MSDKNLLRGFVLDWLDEHEGEMDDDDSCFYALCRAVREQPQFTSTSTAEMRRVYDAEKGER